METNSLKSKQLNWILDKISENENLSDKEINFLDNLQDIDDCFFGEFGMLTNKDIAEKIEYLLKLEFEIICNLCDDFGPIQEKIIDVYEKDNIRVLLLEKNNHFDLEDNYLYDLRYDFKYSRFSVESNNKYFELIPIKND